MITATLMKRPAELRTYKLSFAAHPELVAGATIASVESGPTVTKDPTSATDLTLGGNQILSDAVQFTVAAGQAGARYLLVLVVVLSTGAKLKEAGVISVVEPTMPSV